MNTYFDCDLHIHSIASGHAFNTIDEIINYSLNNGYKMIGISDHGPNMEGAPHVGYFECLFRLPKEKNGMKILYGCEANIINNQGKIDLPDYVLVSLDYVMAGLHNRTNYTSNDCSINTKTLVEAIKSQKIDIISHPISLNFVVDPIEIVQTAVQNNVILEINKSVLLAAVIQNRTQIIEQIIQLLHHATSHGAKLIFGSDAHYVSEIGLSPNEAKLIEKTYSISLDNVLNHNRNQLYDLLKQSKHRRGHING